MHFKVEGPHSYGAKGSDTEPHHSHPSRVVRWVLDSTESLVAPLYVTYLKNSLSLVYANGLEIMARMSGPSRDINLWLVYQFQCGDGSYDGTYAVSVSYDSTSEVTKRIITIFPSVSAGKFQGKLFNDAKGLAMCITSAMSKSKTLTDRGISKYLSVRSRRGLGSILKICSRRSFRYKFKLTSYNLKTKI